jgi:lipopolysaccharide biosynthesis glycosyltransferase
MTDRQSNGQPVHLALSILDLADVYNRHAGATIRSFLEYCDVPAVIHLLYDEQLTARDTEAAEANRQKYQELADVFGAVVCYHHIEVPEWLSELPVVQRLTKGSLMRLWLPECLSEVPRIIYLDCDVIVKTDICSLWNTNLGDCALGAVGGDTRAATTHLTKTRFFEISGTEPDAYFNAGILLLNLEKLRQNNICLYEEALTFLKKYPDTLYPDQDALNYIFHGNYYQLPNKYNVLVDRKTSEPKTDDVILHFAGLIKPWAYYSGPADDEYWYYLSLTPWGEGRNLYPLLRHAPDPKSAPVLAEDCLSFRLPLRQMLPELMRFNLRVMKNKLVLVLRFIHDRR